MAKVIKGVDPESKYFFDQMSKRDKKLKADLNAKKTAKKTVKKTTKNANKIQGGLCKYLVFFML